MQQQAAIDQFAGTVAERGEMGIPGLRHAAEQGLRDRRHHRPGYAQHAHARRTGGTGDGGDGIAGVLGHAVTLNEVSRDGDPVAADEGSAMDRLRRPWA